MAKHETQTKAEEAVKALRELLNCGDLAPVDRGVLGRALMVAEEIRDERSEV